MTTSKLQPLILAHLKANDRQDGKQIAKALEAHGYNPKVVARSIHALSESRQIFKVGFHGQYGVWSLHEPKSYKTQRYVAPFRELTPADHDIWSHKRMAEGGR